MSIVEFQKQRATILDRFRSAPLRSKEELQSLKDELKQRKQSTDLPLKLEKERLRAKEERLQNKLAKATEEGVNNSYRSASRLSNNLLRDISSYKSKIDRDNAIANEDHPPASPLKENKLRVSRIHVDAHRMPMYKY